MLTMRVSTRVIMRHLANVPQPTTAGTAAKLDIQCFPQTHKPPSGAIIVVKPRSWNIVSDCLRVAVWLPELQ
jgi:hypothetical protein